MFDQNSHRAILIGAGATRACYPNAPLDNDFFKLLRHRNIGLYQRAVDELTREFPQYANDGLIDHGLEKIMMESNILLETEQYGFMDAIRKGLHNLLIPPMTILEPDKPKTLYDKLLFHSKLGLNDFFINLNYDFLLDNAVMKFNEFYTGVSRVDYGLDNVPRETFGNITVNSNAAHTIYKPHGSLNWMRMKNDKIGVNNYPYGIESIDRTLIIPPGNKNFQIVREIWNQMDSRLANSTELVIIGCSLSPHDTELRELLSKHYGPDSKKSVKIIHRGDEKLIENFKGLFGEKIKHFQNGFNNEGIEFIFRD